VSHHCGSNVASIQKGGECFGHKKESIGKEKSASQKKGGCKKESPCQKKSCHEKTVVFSDG
jgi:hypothetical protein